MLHHEESPEKPQYNMATLPFLDKPPPFCLPPFLANIFRPPPPPFASILKKFGGGEGPNYVELHLAQVNLYTRKDFKSSGIGSLYEQ